MKRFLALLVTITLLLTGCGGKGSDDKAPAKADPAPAPAAKDEKAGAAQGDANSAATFTNLESPKQLTDILKRFALLSYEFASAEDTTRVTLRRVGQETVEGAPADHVSVELKSKDSEAQKIDLWVNAAGKTVKLTQAGQEVPSQMIEAMGSAVLMSLLWPFSAASQMGLDAALKAGSATGPYQVTKSSKQKKQIGGLSVDTSIFEVKARGVAESGTYTWEVANFGSFQMFTRWEAVANSGGQTVKAEYRIVEVTLR